MPKGPGTYGKKVGRPSKQSGGMLSREQYGAGALVKAVLGLRKGATKATGRASEEVRIQKEFDSLMKEHNKDLGKLDDLKKNNATEKQLTALKDKIRNDTEDLMMLEESLDAFKNYSPGGRQGNVKGGMLSREQYGAGALVRTILNLKKGTTKAPGRAGAEAKQIKEYEKLMKQHKLDLGKLDEIKDTGSEKQIKELKEKIKYDTQYLMTLEETIKDLKGYSPGGRRGEAEGGLLSDDRQTYGFGGIIKAFIKQANKNKAKAKENKSSRQAMDDSTDMAERGMVEMEDAVKMLDEGVPEKDVKMFLEASGYVKKDIDDLLSVYKKESGPQGKMTQDEIFEEYDRLEMKDGGKYTYAEGGSMDDQMMMAMSAEPMESDNSMEKNYTNFIMEEALTDEEEDMLVSKLEQDEELQMLFDKVIDVAQEFAGSGPVDGPGSGVSDSIPARLSDGEFVFTAKATEQIGEDKLMSMMKDAEAQADERQGFATGMGVGDTGEEEIFSNVDKTSVVNKGTNLLEEDEMSKNIKRNMNNPSIQSTYVRS